MTRVYTLRSVAQAGKERDPAWYRWHRKLSIHITRAALPLGVQADHASALMIALGIAAAMLVAARSPGANALGFVLAYVAFLLDKVDGELARARGRSSPRGILLDRFHHRLVEPALFLGVAWHELSLTGSWRVLAAGFATVLLANVIEEHQQLPAYILYKHVRDGGSLPAPPARPRSASLERANALLRPLKLFRTLALALPVVAGCYVVEALTQRNAPTWYLEAGALALAAYTLFQCVYLVAGGVEFELAAIQSVLRRAMDEAREVEAPERPARLALPMEVGERNSTRERVEMRADGHAWVPPDVTRGGWDEES